MDNERIAINIRVTQPFIDKLNAHCKAIEAKDPLHRRLSRSEFIRSIVEKAIEEGSDE
jgi:phage gpG-like protein